MSKSFALAGLRVGWLATHDADLLRLLSAGANVITTAGQPVASATTVA